MKMLLSILALVAIASVADACPTAKRLRFSRYIHVSQTFPLPMPSRPAVRLCGLVLRNGMWGFKLPNSWTSHWGVNGYGILPEKRVEEGCQVFQSWALRCTTQEPGNFPAPKI